MELTAEIVYKKIIVGVSDLALSLIPNKDAVMAQLIKMVINQIRIIILDNMKWLSYKVETIRDQSMVQAKSDLRVVDVVEFRVSNVSVLISFLVEFTDYYLTNYVTNTEVQAKTYEIIESFTSLYKILIPNNQSAILDSVNNICRIYNKRTTQTNDKTPRQRPSNGPSKPAARTVVDDDDL